MTDGNNNKFKRMPFKVVHSFIQGLDMHISKIGLF